MLEITQFWAKDDMIYSTKKINIGGVYVGGGESVKIQSMCTTKTSAVDNTVNQITKLAEAGCEIIRVSVLDEEDAIAVKKIKERISIPIVADIHFSSRLAVLAIENGADKIRINPGNIGGEKEIKLVADCIKSHKISVRVGANTGSVEEKFLKKYGKNENSLVESALNSVSVLERYGVNDIVISVKASSVPLTVKAYRLLASRTDYPLHLGVTEAGTEEMAVVKSSAALGWDRRHVAGLNNRRPREGSRCCKTASARRRTGRKLCRRNFLPNLRQMPVGLYGACKKSRLFR